MSVTMLALVLKRRGISQKEFARKSKCTEAAISRYCKGERVPNLISAKRMSEALGWTLDDFARLLEVAE